MAGDQWLIGRQPILSLVDRIYAISMPELVARLRLVQPIAAALERREGPLGELLQLVEHLENLDVGAAWAQLAALGIPRDRAFGALRLAFAWKSALR